MIFQKILDYHKKKTYAYQFSLQAAQHTIMIIRLQQELTQYCYVQCNLFVSTYRKTS